MWVVCMHCFDQNSSGCIGMLPDKLLFYSVLSVRYLGLPLGWWLAHLSRINSGGSATRRTVTTTSTPKLGTLSSYDASSPKFNPFIRFYSNDNSYSAPARALSAQVTRGPHGGTPPRAPLPPLSSKNSRIEKQPLFASTKGRPVPLALSKWFLLGHLTYRALITTYGKLAADATQASPRLHAATYS
jgi:hypothetical protein